MWLYRELEPRELSVDVRGGFDGGCDGTVVTGLYAGSGARGRDVFTGILGGTVGGICGDGMVRGPNGRRGGIAGGEGAYPELCWERLDRGRDG